MKNAAAMYYDQNISTSEYFYVCLHGILVRFIDFSFVNKIAYLHSKNLPDRIVSLLARAPNFRGFPIKIIHES